MLSCTAVLNYTPSRIKTSHLICVFMCVWEKGNLNPLWVLYTLEHGVLRLPSVRAEANWLSFALRTAWWSSAPLIATRRNTSLLCSTSPYERQDSHGAVSQTASTLFSHTHTHKDATPHRDGVCGVDFSCVFTTVQSPSRCTQHPLLCLLKLHSRYIAWLAFIKSVYIEDSKIFQHWIISLIIEFWGLMNIFFNLL